MIDHAYVKKPCITVSYIELRPLACPNEKK